MNNDAKLAKAYADHNAALNATPIDFEALSAAKDIIDDLESEGTTSAAELEDQLGEILNGFLGERVGIWSLVTFVDAGVMTRDKGLVLKLDDGAEFQITIVKSR